MDDQIVSTGTTNNYEWGTGSCSLAEQLPSALTRANMQGWEVFAVYTGLTKGGGLSIEPILAHVIVVRRPAPVVEEAQAIDVPSDPSLPAPPTEVGL